MFEILPNWHPVLVHFTVALFSISIGLYFISHFMKQSNLKNEWSIVARWALWIGSGITVLTVLSGWYAYNTVTHDTPSHIAMTDHRNWAITTAIIFLLLAGWSIWKFRNTKNTSIAFVVALLVAGGLLGSTAWRGGEVVYRYGLGVMSMPGMSERMAENMPEASGNDDHEHDSIDSAYDVETRETVKTEPMKAEKAKDANSHDNHNHEH